MNLILRIKKETARIININNLEADIVISSDPRELKKYQASVVHGMRVLAISDRFSKLDYCLKNLLSKLKNIKSL